MIVGVVLDGQGRPICCELWPGNTADVTTLIPVVDRLRKRFGVGKVCIVADRGMISKETTWSWKSAKWKWCTSWGRGGRGGGQQGSLVAPGRYRVVPPTRKEQLLPPLDVKGSGWRTGATSSVATRTRPGRMPRIERPSWRRSPRETPAGEKSLVGNKGYRRYLSTSGRSLPDRRQDRGGGSLRRQVGASHQPGPGPARGLSIQAALDGGGIHPLVQVITAPPDRSTTSAMRRSAATCSAPSSHWC